MRDHGEGVRHPKFRVFWAWQLTIMQISEIYKSIQGEGFLAGTASIFVRSSGCNLRCWFCDTPHASWRPQGEDVSINEILDHVAEIDCDHIVITGGEPMLCSELIPLCDGLKAAGRHVTIETAGTLYLPLKCDLMSLSPKFSSSAPSAQRESKWHCRHQRTRHAPDVIRQLVRQYPYQIKFVIDTRHDCEEVNKYLEEFPQIDRARVMLMPQGVDLRSLWRVADWLEPYCHQNNLRFCPRKQIEWFGLARRT